MPVVREMKSPAERVYDALRVITEDDRIANWLLANDPKAFAQANAAMTAFEAAKRLLTATDWCESDGSGTCLIHFGRLEDGDGDEPDVCDLSPDYED